MTLHAHDDEKVAALLALRHSNVPPPPQADSACGEGDDERNAKRPAIHHDVNGFATASALLAMNNNSCPPPIILVTDDFNGSRGSLVSLSSRSTTAARGLAYDELPVTMEDARQQLESAFFGLDEWCESGEHDPVVESLARFPALAAEKFLDSTGESFHPLVHLMFNQAGLENIREVYNLYRDVLAVPQGEDQNLPLHFACVLDDDEVTAFLVRAYPVALTKQNGSGMLPLHRAMAKKQLKGGAEKATFALIRLLVNFYPQSVILPTAKGMTALDYVLHEGYDIFVLYFILQSLPQVIQNFTVGKMHHGQPVVLDLDKTRVLEKILPQALELRCEPSLWTSEGLILLLHCLRSNPSATRKVRLQISPSDMSNSECRFAFKQALETNTHLHQLVLVCSEQESNKDSSSLLQSLRDGVQASQSLQILQFAQYRGRMLDLITLCPNIVVVDVAHLEFCDVAYAWNPNPEMLRSSRMTSLTLTSCAMNPACMRKLLEQLVHIPSLQALSLDIVGDMFQNEGKSSKESRDLLTQQFNMTAPLLALLRKGTLSSLCLGAYPVLDLQPLCEELKYNTILQVLMVPSCFATDQQAKEEAILEVLVEHNTTLLQIMTASQNEQITHYTTLNACGRSKLRDATTTRRDVIEHICSIAMFSVLNEMQKLSVMYGLLRESPSRWSLPEMDASDKLTVSSRKRSRGLKP
jgi:hypothetical protein